MKTFWIILALALASSVSADIVFSELMYDLPGADDSREWVEVANSGNGSVNISGWKLFEAGVNHGLTVKNGSFVLAAGGYAVIADDADAFFGNHSGFNGTLLDSTFSLGNDGETLVLKNKSGSVMANLTYNGSWGGGGNNRTLEKKNLSGGDDTGNWGESTQDGGTPGVENSITAEASATTTSSTTSTTTSTLETTTSSTTSTLDASTTTTSSTTTLESATTSSTTTSTVEVSTTSSTTISTSSTITSTSTTTSTVSTTTLFGVQPPTQTNQSLGVVFAEVMYDPPGADDGLEWVEVANAGNGSVNLSGWKLYEGGVNHGLAVVQGSETLHTGGHAIIADDAYAFLSAHLNFNGTVFDSSWQSLSNTGETLAMKNASGDVVANLTYNASWGGAGNNRTLEKRNLTGGDDASNWGESAVDGGTPGAVNSIAGCGEGTLTPTTTTSTTMSSTSISTTSTSTSSTSSSLGTTTSSSTIAGHESPPEMTLPADVLISEIMYNPSSEQGSDSEYEYVELQNRGNFSVDLANWSLKDDEKEEKLVGYNNGSRVIPAFGYAVITDEDTKVSVGGGAIHLTTGDNTLCSRGLSNDGEVLVLKDALGNVVDQASYTKYDGGNGNGRSLERTDRGWVEGEVGGSPGRLNTVAVRPERHRCEDGTIWSNCSKERPLYCRRGTLEPRCGECGCGRGETCLQNGSCGIKSQENATASVKTREFEASQTTLETEAAVEDAVKERAAETTLEPTSTTIQLRPPVAVSADGMPTGYVVDSRSGRGVGAVAVGVAVILIGLIARNRRS